MTISRQRKNEIEAIKDKDIDYGDIPETDADFWANAELIEPDRTQHVTLRVKKSVLDHFKAEGKKGYQTRINAVLESYVQAQEKNRDRYHETIGNTFWPIPFRVFPYRRPAPLPVLASDDVALRARRCCTKPRPPVGRSGHYARDQDEKGWPAKQVTVNVPRLNHGTSSSNNLSGCVVT